MYHVVHKYLHNAWTRHQDAEYWIVFSIEKGLTFYQTRSNAIILQETLPAYCIPKVVRMKTGEVLYEQVNMPPPPPPKISLEHEWKRDLDSEHAHRPEVGQLSGSFQSNQPTPNPIRERSARPDKTHDLIGVQDGRKTSLSQEIDVIFCEEPSSSERTRRLVTTLDVINVSDSSQTRSARASETFNVKDEILRK